MRAAAEMKKTAASQQGTTGGKGMLGVILPMYAVGIVIYLIYTLTKVTARRICGFVMICVAGLLASRRLSL